jgi:hypothetical protein
MILQTVALADPQRRSRVLDPKKGHRNEPGVERSDTPGTRPTPTTGTLKGCVNALPMGLAWGVSLLFEARDRRAIAWLAPFEQRPMKIPQGVFGKRLATKSIRPSDKGWPPPVCQWNLRKLFSENGLW